MGGSRVIARIRALPLSIVVIVIVGLVLWLFVLRSPRSTESGFWVHTPSGSNTEVIVVDLDSGNGRMTACSSTSAWGGTTSTATVHDMTVKGIPLSTDSTDRYWVTGKTTPPPSNVGTGLRFVTPTGDTIDFLPSTPSEAHRLYTDYCR